MKVSRRKFSVNLQTAQLELDESKIFEESRKSKSESKSSPMWMKFLMSLQVNCLFIKLIFKWEMKFSYLLSLAHKKQGEGEWKVRALFEGLLVYIWVIAAHSDVLQWLNPNPREYKRERTFVKGHQGLIKVRFNINSVDLSREKRLHRKGSLTIWVKQKVFSIQRQH